MSGASRPAGGGPVLLGTAPGGSEVRLRSPTGEAFAATAADDGGWSLTLPPAPQPRMFAFEAVDQGRVLHAEGALIVLPPPGPAAAMARAGYGARVIGLTGAPLRILSLDYDAGGGGAVSGAAPAGSDVRLLIDDRPAASGVADRGGAFTLLDLGSRVGFSQGVHDFRVEMRGRGGGVAVQGRWLVGAVQDPGAAMFTARREGGAFRIDWRLPGGGLQTTVVLDPRELAS